jgi:uncharacterized protein DUF397
VSVTGADQDLTWVRPDPPGPWRKSSYSFSNGNCVEVRGLGAVVEVRDSKNPQGPVLRLTHGQWQALLGGIRSGSLGA